jgi:inorganic pyrophosphatase
MSGLRYDRIEPFPGESHRTVQVVVETPRQSRSKHKYDPDLRVFKLHKVLPAGLFFPFDFGFVPRTIAEDGDPLDVLLFLDEPSFVGCVLEARPIGVIEARQTENGETIRNDRVIAVASEAPTYRSFRSLADLDPHLLEQIERFFVTYNLEQGKQFEPIARRGPRVAQKLIETAMARARKRR